jgi:hypothetical protein
VHDGIDATGETLNAIARATTVQFEHADVALSAMSSTISTLPGAARCRR